MNMLALECLTWVNVSVNSYFYIDNKEEVQGPVSSEELQKLIADGKLTWTTQVWEAGNDTGLVVRWQTGFPERWKAAWIALGLPREPSKIGEIGGWMQRC